MSTSNYLSEQVELPFADLFEEASEFLRSKTYVTRFRLGGVSYQDSAVSCRYLNAFSGLAKARPMPIWR
jgi:hypothetical protein